ncbi:MAG: hypothetical protein IJC48_06885 [Clostridia bacterium]|nr:hypothetical protein [Clostridia bacterium]
MKRILTILLIAVFISMPASIAASEEWHYANWYEIFVSSYRDSDGDGIGDLRGVIDSLDYIEDMGYTGIWLMPVMPSPSYHKYDVTDYKNIAPEYGTLEDMKALVNACHERNIRIIIDMPVNHTSTRHPWFLSAAEALQRRNTESPYIEYYNFTEKEGMNKVKVSGTGWYYEEQFAGGNMPDLNLENEKVLQEIEDIFRFWLTDIDADGFRFDAVTSYFTNNTQKNTALLKKLKDMAERIKPGSYIVAEAWTSLTDISAYYESGIDSFFLFPASQAEGYIARTIRARSPGSTYVKYLEQVYEAIPNGIIAPFIGNHDTGRAVGSLQARSSPERAKFAEALVNLMGGATFTYYGEEIGMVGSGEDPNKRLAMYWNDEDMTLQPPGVTSIEYAYPSVDEQIRDENSLLNYCKRLNHIKIAVPSIARGKTEILDSGSSHAVLKRVWEEETSVIVINLSAKNALEYELNTKHLSLYDVLSASGGESYCEVSENGASLSLAPYTFAVLVKK